MDRVAVCSMVTGFGKLTQYDLLTCFELPAKPCDHASKVTLTYLPTSSSW